MGDFTLRVVRADDLLVLGFEFFNLKLGPATAGTPRSLVRILSTAEARIVVHFQPQHISEEAFDQNVGTPSTFDRIRSFIAAGSRLAFRLPAGLTSIPLTLDSLLNWEGLVPILPPRVNPPRAPADGKRRSSCRIA